MIEIYTPGHLSGTATLAVVMVVLTALGGALAWAVHAWRTQQRTAAEARASVVSGTLPARGAVVLHGTVETEEPSRPAITVTLWEYGTEAKGKHGWSHTWTERRRETKVEPFYLALENATIVRVEPDDDVLLVDKLDSVTPGNPRTRRAELTHGEKAYVSGVIGRGFHARVDSRRTAESADAAIPGAHGSAYRGGPSEGLVLRTSRRDRMLVSTEPLERRYVRQANAHRLFVGILAVALVFASTVGFGATLVTAAFGTHVDAEIVSARHWTTKSKNTVSHHYAVTARYTTAKDEAVTLVENVNEDLYRVWEAKRLARVPFVVAFDEPRYSSLGSRATIHAARAVAGVAVTLALLLFYRAALRGALEWYDKRRVVTTGEGRLLG